MQRLHPISIYSSIHTQLSTDPPSIHLSTHLSIYPTNHPASQPAVFIEYCRHHVPDTEPEPRNSALRSIVMASAPLEHRV